MGQRISPNTVRLELALLDQLYTVAIQEWGLGVEARPSYQEVVATSGHKSMQMLRRYTLLRAEDLVEKLDVFNVVCRV